MSLQDWFYLLGVIYMIMGIVLMFILVWVMLWIMEQIKEIRRELETTKNKLLLQLSTATETRSLNWLAAVPVVWRLVKRVWP